MIMKFLQLNVVAIILVGLQLPVLAENEQVIQASIANGKRLSKDARGFFNDDETQLQTALKHYERAWIRVTGRDYPWGRAKEARLQKYEAELERLIPDTAKEAFGVNAKTIKYLATTRSTIKDLENEIRSHAAAEAKRAKAAIEAQLRAYEKQLKAYEATVGDYERKLACYQTDHDRLSAKIADQEGRIDAHQQALDTFMSTAKRVLLFIGVLIFLRVFGPSICRVITARVLRGRTFKTRRVLG
jgi:chromosome segregation ATPase